MNTGIILVQHGDFPFEFKEKHEEMFKFIKQMLEGVSQETRKITRESNDPYSIDMQKIKDSIKSCGGLKNFEIGFMEFSSPTIEEAVEKIGNKGVRKIILVNAPGIFMRSSHSLIDIPKIVDKIQSDHPHLKLIYAQPGGFLEEMAEVMVRRIDKALGIPCKECQIETNPVTEDYGVVLVAHGDVPLDYLEKKDMNMAEEHSRNGRIWFEIGLVTRKTTLYYMIPEFLKSISKLKEDTQILKLEISNLHPPIWKMH